MPTFVECAGNPYDKAWLEDGERRDLDPVMRVAFRLKINRESVIWQAEQKARQQEANQRHSQAPVPQPRAPKADGRVGFSGRSSGEEQPEKRPTPPTSGDSSTKESRAKIEPVHAHLALAAQAGVSPATTQRGQSVANKAPEMLDNLASEEIGLGLTMRELKRPELVEKLERIDVFAAKNGSNTYGAIVIHPPYPSGYLGYLRYFFALGAKNIVVDKGDKNIGWVRKPSEVSQVSRAALEARRWNPEIDAMYQRLISIDGPDEKGALGWALGGDGRAPAAPDLSRAFAETEANIDRPFTAGARADDLIDACAAHLAVCQEIVRRWHSRGPLSVPLRWTPAADYEADKAREGLA